MLQRVGMGAWLIFRRGMAERKVQWYSELTEIDLYLSSQHSSRHSDSHLSCGLLKAGAAYDAAVGVV